ESVGVSRCDERLGSAVTALLPKIGADRTSAMVPYDSGRVGSAPPAAIQNLPAHVDVISGSPVHRVEASDFDEYRSPERHVATGDVLGAVVGEQHMRWSARGERDTLTGLRIGRRRQVGA